MGEVRKGLRERKKIKREKLVLEIKGKRIKIGEKEKKSFVIEQGEGD
jgi:hypothetical protein